MGRVAVGWWREMIGDVRKESFPSALFFFLVLVLLSFCLLCSTFHFAAFYKRRTWEAKGRDGGRSRGRCATWMGAKRKWASSCGLFPVESLEWAVYKYHTLNYTHSSFQHMNFGSIGIVRWFGEEAVQVKSSTCLFSTGKHIQAVNFQSLWDFQTMKSNYKLWCLLRSVLFVVLTWLYMMFAFYGHTRVGQRLVAGLYRCFILHSNSYKRTHTDI